MRKNNFLIKVCMGLFLCLGLHGTSLATGPNLVTNPGFELGPTGFALPGIPNAPQGWNIENPGLPSIYLEILDDPSEPSPVAEHGMNALKQFGFFTGGFSQTLTFQDNIPSTPGESYDACIEMYVDSGDAILSGASGMMRLVFFDNMGNEISGINSEFVDSNSPTDTWMDRCVTEIAPAGTATMGIFLFFFQNSVETGAIFYDNASVCVSRPIPTLGTWAIIGLAMIILIAGVHYLKQKQISLVQN